MSLARTMAVALNGVEAQMGEGEADSAQGIPGVTVTGLAEKDGKRISFNEFTAFGARVAGLTLLMSSAYLAMWLYIGSTVVNVAGVVVLLGVFAMTRFSNTRSASN